MSDPPKPAAPEANRIVSVRFSESVPFNAECMSVVAPNVTIVPARLEPDGRAVPIEKGQMPVGLLLTQRYNDRVANRPRMERVFVPMALVRGIVYGE
jgi:hypothetical protein